MKLGFGWLGRCVREASVHGFCVRRLCMSSLVFVWAVTDFFACVRAFRIKKQLVDFDGSVLGVHRVGGFVCPCYLYLANGMKLEFGCYGKG